MSDFIKIKAYIAKYGKFSGTWNDGRSSDDRRATFLIESQKEDIVLNLNEIAFFKKIQMNALNEKKCHIVHGDLRSFNTKENDAYSANCMKLAVGEDTYTIVDDRGFVKKANAGLIILRNGIQTNLGLNGMDVDQKLYVTLDSIKELEKKLFPPFRGSSPL